MNDYQTLLKKHNILPEVEELALKGKVVSAIKLVKESTGLGLKESKDIVDHLLKNEFINMISKHKSLSHESSHDSGIEEQVRNLLDQNKKLEAVKLVYETAGMNLKDAKDFVDDIERKEKTFSLESAPYIDNTNVEMINDNGRITVKIRQGDGPQRIIYPDGPDWNRAKAMLGSKPELLAYEKEFFEGKHPVQKQQSKLFVEGNSYGKWGLFLFLFCFIMLLFYFFYYI